MFDKAECFYWASKGTSLTSPDVGGAGVTCLLGVPGRGGGAVEGRGCLDGAVEGGGWLVLWDPHKLRSSLGEAGLAPPLARLPARTQAVPKPEFGLRSGLFEPPEHVNQVHGEQVELRHGSQRPPPSSCSFSQDFHPWDVSTGGGSEPWGR